MASQRKPGLFHPILLCQFLNYPNVGASGQKKLDYSLAQLLYLFGISLNNLAFSGRSLTNSLEDTDGIIADFAFKGEEKRLEAEVELSLFRIVQEALNNVKKHAEASEVHVVAEFNGNGIGLSVRDNGKGFEPPRNMDSLPRHGRLGLMGIRERVWLLGGTIEINTAPGKGTTVLVNVPVQTNGIKQD
jgi:signal transduction histidine kinase